MISILLHHDALGGGVHFGDEGAANHNRLCARNTVVQGIELFVYGKQDFGDALRQLPLASLPGSP